MNFEAVPLAALASPKQYALVGGPFGSKLTSADYVAEGIPVIRGVNLTAGRYLNERDFVFVSEQKMREDLFGNLAHPGDLVFTQRGTLGQVSIIPENAGFDAYVISQSQMKLSLDSLKADVRFIYYWFSSSQTVEKIISQNSSSGVPHINLTVLRNFKVPTPPLREQLRIAEILSAYDDLIESNQRRIALLEDAARMLYREWFIHFRFPGHEHVNIIDGIPMGWERRQLGELAKIRKGKNITKDTTSFGTVPVVAGGLLPAYFHDEANAIGPVITVSASGANAGFVALYNTDIWASDCSYLSSSENKNWIFLYALMKARQAEITAMQRGAAQPHVYPKDLARLAVIYPTEMLVKLYMEPVSQSFEMISNLKKQNTALAQARDLLLPRLMNGEIVL